MPGDLSGTWLINRHDDFTPFLDKLQIPADRRPPAKIEGLQIGIKQDGDKMTFTTTTPHSNHEQSFTVGETFEFVMMGRLPPVEVTSSWDGERMVFTDQRGVKLTREIVNGELMSTFSVGDTAVKLFYTKA